MKPLSALVTIIALSLPVAAQPVDSTGWLLTVTQTSRGQLVETPELKIEILEISQEAPDGYGLKIMQTDGRLARRFSFPSEGGHTPTFVEINFRNFCGAQVFLVTLRYDIPQSADILQNLSETHMFLQNTLEYVGSFPGSYEDLAPLEDGVDLGYPYEMPQPFRVNCLSDEADPSITIRHSL